MTVPSAINKSGPYTGNGVTTVFPYGFRILDASHILVVMTEGGIDAILTTGFTVSGIGNGGGGNVTFAVAPTAAQKITLIRNAPFTQPTDLENQGAYYAETIEDALDLAVMRDQQLAEAVDRAVKVPVGQDIADFAGLISDITRLADSAAQIDTVAAVAADVDVVAGIAADVSLVADLAADVTNFADVYQGPKSVPPTVRNDGSPIQVGDIYFDTLEDRMKVRNGAAIWENAASSVNGTLNRRLYTATAGQTVFAVTYDVGFVDVWLNGVKLVGGGDDFTATNGTSITLTVGATAGDSVDIISFGAFAAANMLEKSLNLSDLPSVVAALTNLGFSTYVQSLRGAANAAAFRTLLGGITVADLAAAAVRLSSEAYASPLDTELATALWAAAGMIGAGQSWTDVTGSRALATSYTNSTGRPISVSVRVNTASGVTVNLIVGGVTVASFANNGTGGTVFTLSAIVPNGATYSATNGTISTWLELR